MGEYNDVHGIECRVDGDYSWLYDNTGTSTIRGNYTNIGTDAVFERWPVSEEEDKVPDSVAEVVTTAVTSPNIRAESDEPEGNDELACVICLAHKRKCAALPCRHLRYCHTCCLDLIQRKNMICAECRAIVTHFEAFY